MAITRLIVIGGAIAGLSAAYYAQKNLPDAKITLLESSDRWGGKITTDRVAFQDGQFIIEGGPDTFLATKPWGVTLCKELGLGAPERPWEGAALFHARRSLEIFRIWEDAFGGKDRLVRVISWQAASGDYWTDKMLLGQNSVATNCDALAIAPYISMLLGPNSKPTAAETTVGRSRDRPTAI